MLDRVLLQDLNDSSCFTNRLEDADDEKTKDVPWPFKVEADSIEGQQHLHTQYFSATTNDERQVK